MSDFPEQEQDHPATLTPVPDPGSPPGGWYFATDLRPAWLPTFGQRPLVLWARLDGEPHPRAVWRLTPHTLAAVRWRAARAANVSAVAQDRLQALIALAAELYGVETIQAAVAELEASGEPPPPLPPPESGANFDINWDCWTGPAVQAWLEVIHGRAKNSA